jgi:hypothetical protein
MNAVGRISEAIRARSSSDEIMSGMWIVLLILSPFIMAIGIVFVVLGLVASAVSSTGVGIGIGSGAAAIGLVLILIGGLIFLLINYKLLKRNNEHSKREAALRQGIIEYFGTKAAERNMGGALASQLATMQSIDSEARSEERERSAGLYSILIIIPFIGTLVQWYVAYILTKFSAKHDHRWMAFAQQTQTAGQALGMTMVYPSWKTIPERSFFLYLVISLITFGLFWIYWYYAFMKDMNEHYKAQWQFEDQLLAAIQSHQ